MPHDISDTEKVILKYLELVDNDNVLIKKEEFVNICVEDGIKEQAVEDCLKHVELDEDDKIHFAEFCRGLGLPVSDLHKERKERLYERQGVVSTVDPSVSIIATSMSQEKQQTIIEKYLNLMEKTSGKPEQVDEVARDLKRFLDETYGRTWQVILMVGSYWMHFSHMPLSSLQFKHGAFIGLVWRTPTV